MEFPFGKLVSVLLQVSFFFVAFYARVIYAFICGSCSCFFVSKAGSIDMESRNAKPILYRVFQTGKIFWHKALARKFNSHGTTLEIGYISCIPEIPKKKEQYFPLPLFFVCFIIISLKPELFFNTVLLFNLLNKQTNYYCCKHFY